MSERLDHLHQSAVLTLSEHGVPSGTPRGQRNTGSNMPSEAQGTKATLARLAVSGASAEETADIAVTTWVAIDAALSPIVGQRGFAALYKRSLQLTGDDFAWLMAAQDGVLQAADFSTLRATLAAQPDSTASAASMALLKTFHELLTTLIGRSLTDRLLKSVWEKPTSGHPAQDTSP